MKAHTILAGAAIAVSLALGATGGVVANWDDDWHGAGMMDPGMMGEHMGSGMMGPGVLDPDIMGPDMMDPSMGPHPHDWWDD
jgi:hypothetical protein